MYKKTGYDAFLFICALICDKRLIPCFSRCDVLASTPHSKNTPYNRFSSNYHRKLYFIICTILRAHLRNQKLSLRRISSKYPRKFMAVCGYFRDKVMRMYDVANAGRSGTAMCVLPQKSLTPKIFHLSVSHRKFLANNNAKR